MLTTEYPSTKRGIRWTISRIVPASCILLVLSLLFTACPKNDAPESSRVGVSVRSPRESPASEVVPAAVAFNGERAMDHVRKQVEIGPRVSGSTELAKTRDYIVNELKSYDLAVSTDEFAAATPVGEKKMVNITAELSGDSKDVIIIASHYETKLYKDMRFVGANDPGTSAGTLLEIGRVLAGIKQKPKLTYWLVFFDGEEAFCEGWEDCGKPDAPDNTYGSRHFVSRLRDRNELGRVRSLILMDLMGYKNLELGRDTMSTKWLQDVIWQTARDLGHASYFVDRPEAVGGDDHEPFLRAGIDSVDIIQLNNYPYWHKADDTLDKVSPRSMKIVGDTVIASLPRIERHLLTRDK
ncbi:MAG: M28 family peptidase [Pyrinomonadaceae bacterium]